MALSWVELANYANPVSNKGSFGSAGGGGIGGIGGEGTAPVKTSESTQNAQNASQSANYFANPGVAGSVIGSTGGLVNQAAGQYNDIVNNPTGSQAFQNSLTGMLAALNPSEQASRRSLADTFRAAGNTASSTYAKGAAGLESNIMRNRGELASNLLAKLYPAVTQAAFAPIGQADSLLNAQKMQQATSSGSSTGDSTSWGFPPQSGQSGSASVSSASTPISFGGSGYGVNAGDGPDYRRTSPNSYFTGPSGTQNVASQYGAPYSGGDTTSSNFTGGGSGDTYAMGDQSWGTFGQDPAGNANYW